MNAANLPGRPDAGRRQVLKLGMAGGAAGLMVAHDASTPVHASDPLPPATTPFAVPLPVYAPKPEVASLTPTPKGTVDPIDGECGRSPHQGWDHWAPQKFYSLRVREVMHSIHPELPLQKVWGYDGMVPGPTIVARYGEPALVRIYNELPAGASGYGSPEISTHLHNLHCGSESDGYAGDYYSMTKSGPTLSAPGSYQDHHYPNCCAGYDSYPDTNGDPREAQGTLWYHDHRQDFTGPNVYRGLTGFYLLFDEIDSGNELDTNPKALRLPSGVGVYDVPLVFQDKVVDSGGYIRFDQFETDGILGNKFCVNGKVQPFFSVARRKYRFRLLNGSPSRFYEFYLTIKLPNGTYVNENFQYIANDGNLLVAPLTMKNFMLAPAERGDIVIDFSKYPIGSELFVTNRLTQTNGRGPDTSTLANPRDAAKLLTKPGTQLLRFNVDRESPTADASRVPSKLRDKVPMVVPRNVKKRTIEFDRENSVWTVNHKVFDVEKAAFEVKLNAAEIWTLEGKGSWHHPVHVHMEEAFIISRNGKAPPLHEQGRKDVFVLAPGEVVQIFIRFRDFTGKYMLHCHNLTHEDHAMMARFDVVP